MNIVELLRHRPYAYYSLLPFPEFTEPGRFEFEFVKGKLRCVPTTNADVSRFSGWILEYEETKDGWTWVRIDGDDEERDTE